MNERLTDTIHEPEDELALYKRQREGLETIAKIIQSSNLSGADKKYCVRLIEQSATTAQILSQAGNFQNIYANNQNFATLVRILIGFWLGTEERRQSLGNTHLNEIRRAVGKATTPEEEKDLRLFINNIS